jgi:nucleoside-diphosphate-sugar epimerase
MKVLITGSLGYVGAALGNFLKANSIEYIGLDLSIFHHADKSENLIIKRFSEIIDSDLRGVDVIVHLAGISNDPIGNKFEDLTHQINFKDSCQLFDMATRSGNVKKFIFASSCSNYGVVGQNMIVDERSTLKPQTAYARSKVEFEEYLESKVDHTDMQVICFRFATACGPSPSMRIDLVLNSFVDSVLKNHQILLTSDGQAYRPLIDVTDMARFIYWGINSLLEDNFTILNAGYDVNNYKIIDLAIKVQSKFPGSEIIYSENAVSDNRSYTVSFDKIKNLTGFDCPMLTIDKSIDGLVALYKSNSMSWFNTGYPKMKSSALKRLDCVNENIEIFSPKIFKE